MTIRTLSARPVTLTLRPGNIATEADPHQRASIKVSLDGVLDLQGKPKAGGTSVLDVTKACARYNLDSKAVIAALKASPTIEAMVAAGTIAVS